MEIDEPVIKYAFILNDRLPMLFSPVQVFEDFLTEPAHDGTLATIAVELTTGQLRLHEVFKLITAAAGTVLASLDDDHGGLECFVLEDYLCIFRSFSKIADVVDSLCLEPCPLIFRSHA